MQIKLVMAALLVVGLSAVLAGCGKSPVQQQQAKPQPTEAATEHAHKEGAHQGVIVEIGRDNYHAEAVFEKEGVIRLYTLGKDDAIVQEVELQSLEAHVKPEGDMEATPVTFEAEPQKGDAAGKTSRFIARLPRELWSKPATVTVPSITIAGQRFRFAVPPVVIHAEPAKVDTDKEKAIFLSPGGKYTPADIRANGNLIPSQKYGVADWHMGDEPKAGDKICPVTASKADPRCTWVIDGKKYEFCCPPCIGKFVKRAKDDPKDIKEPEDYREK
jgi:hypothetical protein